MFRFRSCHNHAPHLRKRGHNLTFPVKLGVFSWVVFLFRFQKNEENCDKAIAEIADHIGRQKAAEGKVLNGLLDQITVDQGMLVEQNLALEEEVQHGLTQVNGFLQEDLKVDVPTGI